MTNEMTVEEAVNILKSERDNDIFVLTEYREKLHKALAMAIKALEQQPFINKPCISEGVCREDKIQVLDKIRAEIDTIPCAITSMREIYINKDKIINIIDKYKAENEDAE